MSYGVVYIITNIVNGKQYVGQTTRELWVRVRDGHFYNAFSKLKNNPFYAALRKYGRDAFVFTEECEASCQEELDWIEDEVIRRLNTLYPNGYNLRFGGGNGKFSETSRAKMSSVYTDEVKIERSKMLKQAWDKPGARERRSAIQRSLDVSSRKSASLLKTYDKDPTFRERVGQGASLAWKNPIRHSRGVDAAREVNSRPEVKAAVSAATKNTKWFTTPNGEHYRAKERRNENDVLGCENWTMKMLWWRRPDGTLYRAYEKRDLEDMARRK